MAKRVAFYARVSTDGQTVQNQLEELQEVAKRQGRKVVATYADRGISGTKGREGRPEFDKLLKAVTRRDIDMVAAWSVDRLGPVPPAPGALPERSPGQGRGPVSSTAGLRHLDPVWPSHVSDAGRVRRI
jgi:hypothetical protein